MYGFDWVICNGGNNDPNLCPGIFMGWPKNGKPNYGGAMTMKVCGYTFSQVTSVYNTWVTGEQLLEIYTAELEHEVETIKNQITKKFGGDGEAVMEELNQDQINGLIDVVYKGVGYMNGTVPLKKPNSYYCQATLLDKLAKRRYNDINIADFYDTNKGHPRRRIADWYMFKEGTYLAHVNNCSYAERFSPDKMLNWKTRYEFLSETPFQDLMSGVKPVEEESYTTDYTIEELKNVTH